METNYYILITCTEQFTYKLNIMLKLLSDQVQELHLTKKEGVKNIKILLCNDDIDILKFKKKNNSYEKKLIIHSTMCFWMYRMI